VDVLLDQKDTIQDSGYARNPSRVLGVCYDVTVHVIGYMKLSDVPATQAELREMVEGKHVAVAD
jgi:hypothetical protein